MQKAGYCKECSKNIWLKEDGSCENGHPPSYISNIYSHEVKKDKRFAPIGDTLSYSAWLVVAFFIYFIGLTAEVVFLMIIGGPVNAALVIFLAVVVLGLLVADYLKLGAKNNRLWQTIVLFSAGLVLPYFFVLLLRALFGDLGEVLALYLQIMVFLTVATFLRSNETKEDIGML